VQYVFFATNCHHFLMQHSPIGLYIGSTLFPVRYELNHKQHILVFQGRATAQPVNRRPVTMETRLRSQASPFEICASRSGNRTGFSTSISFFRCYFQSSSRSILIFIYMLLLLRQRTMLETFETAMPFLKLGNTV